MTRKIAVIPGDGIGPEVTREGVRILDSLGLGLEFVEFDWGADTYLRTGVSLPPGALDDLRAHYAAVYLGAIGDPRVANMQHARDIILGLRFGLDLYVNCRPVRLLHDSICPVKGQGCNDVDFVIFRENTEGPYAGVGGNFRFGTPDEVATQSDVSTRKGVERIIRYAFEYAVKHGRKKVTLGHKANILKFTSGLFLDVGRHIAQEYAGRVEFEDVIIDALAMKLVLTPERFDVIVTTNLFGDILSDLISGLVGGLGLAPGANIGKSGAIFEAVHGTAPDIAGKNVANPGALILAGAMMLDYMGEREKGDRVRACFEQQVRDGRHLTRDLGGTASTDEAVAAVLAHL